MTLYRDELQHTLSVGLQPLIADLSLRPFLEGARFRGWRLQFIHPNESPYRESAIRPGDVVVRVNGGALERPDQMMKVWKSLHDVDHIDFEIIRAGKPLTVTYTVVDRPALGPAPAL